MSRLTITRRLVLLVTVPLLFTGGFAAWALTTTGGEAITAHRLMGLVAVADRAGILADRLQQERIAAVAVLTGDSPFDDLETYERESAATDVAVADYAAPRGQVSGAPEETAALLRRIDDQIARLPALRDAVREGPTVAVSSVALVYRIAVADLVSLREAVAQADGGSAEIVGHLRAAAALSSAIEFAARQEVDVLRQVAAGQPSTPAEQQSLLATRAGFDDASASFTELAPAPWQDWLSHTVTGADVLNAERLEDAVARTPIGGTLTLDRTQWITATAARVALLHNVERRVDAAIIGEVNQLYVGKVRWLVLEAAVVVLALMVAAAMAIVQSRSMIRRLRRLAASARTTAFDRLPSLVEKLRARGSHPIDSEEYDLLSATPHEDPGRDEIGDVSTAFVSVHQQAIKTATELSNMQAGMSQILIHLARRNQRLVAVLIHELDGAERGEEDPERLATLFRLDQLATRMGRYTDNLLVVGGQGAGRVASQSVSLETVLRGAQSKIEHFRQVRYHGGDDRLVVRGDAVHDLTNLLAELLDNATQFSAPAVPVTVDFGLIRHGVLIRISDDGVGVPEGRLAQLNRMLSAPPSINVSSVRSMGLTVVAHIAERYGARVRLRAGHARGTVAELDLPSQICWFEGASPVPVTRAAGPAPGRVPRQRAVADVSSHRDPPIFQQVVTQFAGFLTRRDGPGSAPPRWQGAADGGWAAAAAAAVPVAVGRTGTGLPRRNPMAQLVPGEVPHSGGGAQAVDYRQPAHVAAAVAAFARGNAHSRSLRGGSDTPTDSRDHEEST